MSCPFHLFGKFNFPTSRSNLLRALLTDFINNMLLNRFLGFIARTRFGIGMITFGVFCYQITEHLGHHSSPPDNSDTMSSNIAFA